MGISSEDILRLTGWDPRFKEGGKIPKMSNGGKLRGKSHKQGGIPAIVNGKTPIEVEDGEYIIKKSSVDKIEKKYGKRFLDKLNKTGKVN